MVVNSRKNRASYELLYKSNRPQVSMGYINNSRHLAQNMLGYLSADIICFEKRTVFRERSSRKTVSYENQIMSKDKYPSILSPQMATIVFIILQIFFATRAVLKIGEYSRIFPSFTWGIFGHVTRLDHSPAARGLRILLVFYQHPA